MSIQHVYYILGSFDLIAPSSDHLWTGRNTKKIGRQVAQDLFGFAWDSIDILPA